MVQVEHDVLVDELTSLENFSPEERLTHARQRRIEQLEGYHTRESNPGPNTKASHDKNIRFESNIELIEAAARNDAEEGLFLLTFEIMVGHHLYKPQNNGRTSPVKECIFCIVSSFKAHWKLYRKYSFAGDVQPLFRSLPVEEFFLV